MTRLVETAQLYRRLAETLEEVRGDVVRSLTHEDVHTWLASKDDVDATQADHPTPENRGGDRWPDGELE